MGKNKKKGGGPPVPKPRPSPQAEAAPAPAPPAPKAAPAAEWKPPCPKGAEAPPPAAAPRPKPQASPKPPAAAGGRPGYRRKLEALGYPQWDNVDDTDIEQIRTLVGWLENQKIREYAEEERGGLCGAGVSVEDWKQHLRKYLDELSLSFGLDGDILEPATLATVVQRLLNFAVGVEFRDDAASYNRLVRRAKRLRVAEGQVDDPAEVEAGVNALAAILQVLPAEDPVDTLAAAKAVVDSYLSPEAVAEKGKAQRFDQRTFNLGFSTGDKDLDRAATVLRLLYINDLRQLQTRVNEVVVMLQEFTANPKTDSRLGKVGR